MRVFYLFKFLVLYFIYFALPFSRISAFFKVTSKEITGQSLSTLVNCCKKEDTSRLILSPKIVNVHTAMVADTKLYELLGVSPDASENEIKKVAVPSFSSSLVLVVFFMPYVYELLCCVFYSFSKSFIKLNLLL